MKITHRISLHTSNVDRQAFEKAGISLGSGFSVIRIDEDDPRWPRIAELSKQYPTTDMVETNFSKSELDRAQFLAILPAWHHAYPQPEDDFGFQSATYSTDHYCESCGVGLSQKAEFSLKKEPSWGKKSILQLNWVYDEYFAKPEVWERIFMPVGVPCRAVLHSRSKEALESVVQLQITALAQLDLRDIPFETCKQCGRKKYAIVTRGFQPAVVDSPSAPIFKSDQYFGMGRRDAFRGVYVSNSLFKSISEANLKGVEFVSCSNFQERMMTGSEWT